MIQVADDGDLRLVTLNRPDKANSLTRAMLVDLAEIAEASTQTRTLVITGTGRVFSAGADLDEARAGLAKDPIWERLSGAIAALPGLSICALNGTLAGGAFGMALACDLRISVPSAKFFYPVMKLGFLPQPSDPARLTALIGPARGKLVLMGGQKLTADQALMFGLVDHITAPEDLLKTAADLAADCLAAKPDILHGIKSMCS